MNSRMQSMMVTLWSLEAKVLLRGVWLASAEAEKREDGAREEWAGVGRPGEGTGTERSQKGSKALETC